MSLERCEGCGSEIDTDLNDEGGHFRVGEGRWVYFCDECLLDIPYNPDMRVLR